MTSISSPVSNTSILTFIGRCLKTLVIESLVMPIDVCFIGLLLHPTSRMTILTLKFLSNLLINTLKVAKKSLPKHFSKSWVVFKPRPVFQRSRREVFFEIKFR